MPRVRLPSHFSYSGVNCGWSRHNLAPVWLTRGGGRARGAKLADNADELRLELSPGQPAVTAPMPPFPRSIEPSGTANPPREEEVGPPEPGTLSIGPEISFVGEITACKRLVVDGIVEASVQRCQDVVVGKMGILKGQTRTENAEVSGRIEGDLAVRKLLLIRAAGHVSGTTTYGEIEIERGGRIVGQADAREGAQQGREW